VTKKPLTDELESVITEAFQGANLPRNIAQNAAKIAAHSVCTHFFGRRVRFCEAGARAYRDRAIYESRRALNSRELAALENLSERQIYNIITSQILQRREK